MKLAKKIISLVTIFAIALSIFTPVTRIEAATYGEGEKILKVGITNNLGFSLTNVKVNNFIWTNDSDVFHTTDNKYKIEFSVTKAETSGTKIPNLVYGGNWSDLMTKTVTQNGDTYNYTLNLTNIDANGDYLDLKIEEQTKNPPVTDNNSQVNDNSNQNPPQNNNFDGNATLVWSCGNKVCYKKMTGLSNNTTYVAASTVISETDNTTTFNVNANTKFFALTSKFDNYVTTNNPNWNTLDINTLIGENGIDLRPVDEPMVQHAYVSYGDRNFKVYIYDSEFKAISRGKIEDLSYYPGAWADGLLTQDLYTISGTTKENPVVINNVILDPTVLIDSEAFNTVIKSIKPLDVPAGAVTVKLVDSKYKIDFQSRYYDRVVFELTDTSNNKYYFMINRIAAQAKIDHDNKGNEFIFSSVYFDRKDSYTDYIVTAKIEYKDGTTKTVEMTNANYVDDGLGNTIYDVKEVDSENTPRQDWTKGKGIKISSFKYNLGDHEKESIKNAYVFVEFKGSTKDNYAGALSGSGNGNEVHLGNQE